MQTIITPVYISLITSGIISIVSYIAQSQKYFEKVTKLEDLKISEQLADLRERTSNIESELELILNALHK